jgi:hypothetical protein
LLLWEWLLFFFQKPPENNTNKILNKAVMIAPSAQWSATLGFSIVVMLDRLEPSGLAKLELSMSLN